MIQPGWTHVTAVLIERIRTSYALHWEGIHGYPHWERVRDIGARLVGQTVGADPVVVEYFAALHDSCRLNDDWDPEHGPRAAQLIRTLEATLVPLTSTQIDLLAEACRLHTSHERTDDPTIGTCWDSDRLDLLRVGIVPNPKYLMTAAARNPEMIAWATRDGRGYRRRRREA